MSDKQCAKQEGPGVAKPPVSVPNTKTVNTGVPSLKPVIKPDTKAVKG